MMHFIAYFSFFNFQVFINFVKQQSDGIRDPSITPHAFSPIPADLEESLDDPPAFIEGCHLTRSQVRKNKISSFH